jgi:hypothetical protein
MPTTRQTPKPVQGVVRLDGSPVEGARTWALDLTEGTNIGYKENVSVSYTNGRGEYVHDIADLTTSYANNDLVRIFYQVGEIESWVDVRIKQRGILPSQNISVNRVSGLKDGLKNTLDAKGRFGVEKFGRGLKPGLKDALT